MKLIVLHHFHCDTLKILIQFSSGDKDETRGPPEYPIRSVVYSSDMGHFFRFDRYVSSVPLSPRSGSTPVGSEGSGPWFVLSFLRKSSEVGVDGRVILIYLPGVHCWWVDSGR